MSILTRTEKKDIREKFADLLRHCIRCNKKGDKEMIQRAFDLAYEAHKDMRRKSGEPYIIHPIAVAKIVTHEIGLGAKSITCALLHDVVEDTDYTLEEIKNHFGEKIASIIDGLTKIAEVFDQKSSLQAENFRKILLTLSDDVRAILIKLADRLHNMRTLDSMPPNKQMKIAGETTYLYAPVAHRLGLYAIKTELEDLSLKYHHPKIYHEIGKKIKDNEKRRLATINQFSLPITQKLKKNHIKFSINGRPKSIASIWNKMQRKIVPFEEVYDLLAIRIIFEPKPRIPEKTMCWSIYSLITDIYIPKPDRIRDWVSQPKANGYEALHGTVMGPHGKWVEIQVRSTRMDEIAERGYAAHWKYKTGSNQERELDKWIKKIREMLESPESNALEFLDDFKMNLFSSEILVFTPKGHIKTLPTGSTALDFAYDIHTEIGDKAIGAKVNYKLVGVSHILNSGDQVEILTSDIQQPQSEWLTFAKTAKAKSSIKNALKAETTNRIEKGKQILELKLKEFNLLPSSRIFKKLLPSYEVLNKDELYSKIGTGLISLDDLQKVLRKKSKKKLIRYWKLQFSKFAKSEENKEDIEIKPIEKEKFDFKRPFILRENIDKTESLYTIAKCCNPIPGDDVIGYKTPNENIVIHKSKCPKAIKLMSSEGNRIVSAKWTTHKILSFLTRIRIMGIDKIGMFNEISNLISKELSINMRTINIEVHDGIFDGIFDLYVHNTKDLNNLIMNLIKIKGIDSVRRIETIEE